MMGEVVAWFLVLDVIPEHIQQTFDLSEEGKLRNSLFDQAIKVVRLGEEIPKKLTSAVIIYNASAWHATKATELYTQLREMDPGIKIMSIPVKG